MRNAAIAFLNPNNRLFTLARKSQRQPSALEAIAVVLFILLLVLIPGQMLTRFVMRSFFQGGSESVAGPIVGNVGFLPIYLALWVWLRWSSKRPFWSLGFERYGAPRNVLRGALVAVLF
ncbi:MAG: hypothetical protein ABSB35_25215 [Bryobacteraceae bacterium]|jgi:hypothetical protein